MTHTSPSALHSADVPKRPRGILKNKDSYTAEQSVSPTATTHPTEVPTSPGLELSRVPAADKDLTLANTMQNAGHRRSSSAAGGPMSRRRSSQGAAHMAGLVDEENNPRLKWDEANLYLTEQEKSATMKINEPKTPYAAKYDPEEDEAEMRVLDADDLMVDELDKAREERREKGTRESDIPGLELGDPEEEVPPYVDGEGLQRSDSGKQVVVEPLKDGEGHGEQVGWSNEEKEKHRKFEERRKRHYEMKDIKGLLAHPESPEEDVMDQDEDLPQALPTRQAVVNGSS